MTDQPNTLTPDELRGILETEVPYRTRSGDNDQFLLTIDGVADTVSLESPLDGTAPAVENLRSIRVDEDETSGTYVLTVDIGTVPEISYALVSSVLHDVTVGNSFGAALSSAIEAFRAAIARKPLLSEDKIVGLIGELTVFEHLVGAIGAESALEAWLGPEGEEHDFGIAETDLEVKTTTSEKRVHVISGIDQLKPRDGVPLWVLSLQVTRTGQGEGRSLDDMCMKALSLAEAYGREVKSALKNAGWSTEDLGLYSVRYGLRSVPRAYLVDDDFPSMTSERIAQVVPHFELVGDVRYRVDVSALPYGLPHQALSGFVEEGTASD